MAVGRVNVIIIIIVVAGIKSSCTRLSSLRKSQHSVGIGACLLLTIIIVVVVVARRRNAANYSKPDGQIDIVFIERY